MSCAFFAALEFGESQKDLLRACAREEIDINVPFEELPKADQDFVIEGEEAERRLHRGRLRKRSLVRRPRLFLAGSRARLQDAHARLAQPLSRLHHVSQLQGRAVSTRRVELQNFRYIESETRIRERYINASRISGAFDFRCTRFAAHADIPAPNKTAQMLRDEICARLNYLCEVGVGYLTLDRSTRTLSGGEVQRVNLTTCLGASLVNTLFVMDEPSIGLHPRDVGQLVRVMRNLRDKGNTLLVVEHEEQIIRAADNLIDLGPGRGEHGGELVWNGSLG